jgi:hypothetical protein
MIRLKITMPRTTRKVNRGLFFFPVSHARNQKKRNRRILDVTTGLKSRAGIITSPVIHKAFALKRFS